MLANNGPVVNFGRILAPNAAVRMIEEQIPFSVRADRTGVGQDYQEQNFMSNFSTTYPIISQNTILLSENWGFGILFSCQNSPSSWLTFNSSKLGN